MSIEYRTLDHPEANGRKPLAGENEWRLGFRLEDGRMLYLWCGRTGRDALKRLLDDEDLDERLEAVGITVRREGTTRV